MTEWVTAEYIINQIRKGIFVICIKQQTGTIRRAHVARHIAQYLKKSRKHKDKAISYLAKRTFHRLHRDTLKGTGNITRHPEILIAPHTITICFDPNLLKYPPAGILIGIFTD